MESGDGQEDEMNNRATVSDNSYTALSMLRIGVSLRLYQINS